MWEVHPAIGMISGNGVYPGTFARAARSAGVPKLVAAAFRDETDPILADHVDDLQWFRVGELTRMIRYFQDEGIEKAVMVGQIAPSNLFNLRPDLRTLKLLGRLKQRNAESIFGAIADELAAEGIDLISALTYLDDFLPASGPVFGPVLDDSQQAGAVWAFGIAKAVSAMDIGQTIVVKNGTVLAVEAFEGTNRAIERGGQLGRGKAMVVKVSKPNQDLRFDVPCIGPATLDTARSHGINAVVVEAGKTLLLDRDEVERLCRKYRISLHALASPKNSP